MKPLCSLTLKEALAGLKAGNFTSRELTEAFLERIKSLDPKYHAFITVTDELALNQADVADALIKDLGGPKAFARKPLLGIPYVAKDNFCTEGVLTTAGSNVLDNFVPPYESTVTRRLQDAGAVLLGKTNMDAFAHGSSTETSDFFTTLNPWDPSRVPGGSSGGSAAAVIADMCIFALGSETGGSIRGPASWCGVTGLKPTYGRVSRYGLIAMASSLDSPGPITKTAWDASYVLSVIAGKDPQDATTLPVPVDSLLRDLSQASPATLKDLRIGVAKQYFELDLSPDVRSALEAFKGVLNRLGAELVDVDLLDPKYSIAVYTILQRAEVSSNLARYDGIRFGHDRTHFGFEAKKRMMLGAYTLSAGYYDAFYAKAQKVRTAIVNDFKRAFENVDVIIGPTMPGVALPLGASAENPMFGEMVDMLTEPSTIAGLPGITVPIGFSDGLPIGAQVIGPQLSEALILRVAHAYQQITDFHEERPNL